MRAILSVALTPRFGLIASLLVASSIERPAVSRAQRRIAGVGVGMGQSLHPLRAFVKLSKVVLSKRPAGKAMPVAQSASEVTSTNTGFWSARSSPDCGGFASVHVVRPRTPRRLKTDRGSPQSGVTST